MARYGGTFMHQIKMEMDEALIEPINEAVGEAGMDGLSAATGSSPVCTGRLRSAWRLTLNEPTKSSPKEGVYTCRRGVRRYDRYRGETASARAAGNRSMNRFSIEKHKGIALGNNVTYTPRQDKIHGMLKKGESAMRSTLNKRMSRI